MKNIFNKNNIATIGGYMSAIYNAILVIDIDNLDYSLPSTYLKLFGAILMPIIGGHATQIISNNQNGN
jgi:hypothetical protein